MSRQQQVERSVTELLTSIVEDADFSAACVEMWKGFAACADVSRTRKPATWAAAVYYTLLRMCGVAVSQTEAAAVFGVSGWTVSTKYRQIVTTLSSNFLDRWDAVGPDLPEAMHGEMDDDRLSSELIPEIAEYFGDHVSDEDLAYAVAQEGWNKMDDDEDYAHRCFEKAIQLDPMQGDALYGLGFLADVDGDLDEAERYFRLALISEAENLGSESPADFDWWTAPETQTYMRIRYSLGWLLHDTKRYAEATSEFQALLRLNPDDDQRARQALAPMYLLSGDLSAALKIFDSIPGVLDVDEPDLAFLWCRGFAFAATGRFADAAARIRVAMLENPLVAPMLLNAPVPDSDEGHVRPVFCHHCASVYAERFTAMWQGKPTVLALLQRIWNDPEVVADVVDVMRIYRQLLALQQQVLSGVRSEPMLVLGLETQKRTIVERGLSKDALRRILRES